MFACLVLAEVDQEPVVAPDEQPGEGGTVWSSGGVVGETGQKIFLTSGCQRTFLLLE
ncbi:MAG: hypothetical protein JXO50_07350 [Deltaproteobacteria bacterium]|nr:hypothetical protein [Candidatus Anaeroferrophillus wilburensis]